MNHHELIDESSSNEINHFDPNEMDPSFSIRVDPPADDSSSSFDPGDDHEQSSLQDRGSSPLAPPAPVTGRRHHPHVRILADIPCFRAIQDRYPSVSQNTIFVACVIFSLVLLVSILTIMALLSVDHPPHAPADATARYFHLAALWNNETLANPLTATYLGVPGPINGLLPDLSWEALQAGAARRQALYEASLDLDPDALDARAEHGEARINARILREELRLAFLRDQFLALDQLMPVSSMVGPQLELPAIIPETPFATPQDFSYYLQRLAAIPRYLDQTIDLLRRGVAAGLTQPCDFIQFTAAQIEGQLVPDPRDSVFYQPFVDPAHAAHVSPAQRDQGLRLVREAVLPAFARLQDYWRGTYLGACHTDTVPIGLGALPRGADYYDALVKAFTTDPTVDAASLHALGLQQVSLVRTQMEATLAQLNYTGRLADFMDAMRNDTAYQFASPAAALLYARDFGKQIDGRLPAYFAVLPRCPYAIVPVPDAIAESSPGGYYDPPDPECSRPGVFHLNTYGTKVTKFLLPSLFLHEAVPGHHLQIALANELRDQPLFRVNGDWTAFIEGWAHFAEYFGEELGLYADPVINIGRLSDAMLRACRLVIDTGLHNGTMTRQQAIDLLTQNSALALDDIIAEVDRYGSWPGQAVAYRFGMLTFSRIQANAKNRLGAQFDERSFNSALLSHGALPLNILEELMNEYIENHLDSL